MSQTRPANSGQNGRRRNEEIVQDEINFVQLPLDRVSLDIREGEFICILGPSGCGKSTLLWSMAGLHELSGGEIRLGKEKITGPHPEIAMIFQDANLLPWRNLAENIALPFELKHRKPDKERIAKLLRRVSLEGFEAKYPRDGSRRDASSVVFITSSGAWPSLSNHSHWDEPFSALDCLHHARRNEPG